jgi:hypothetical protein
MRTVLNNDDPKFGLYIKQIVGAPFRVTLCLCVVLFYR